MTKFYFIVMKEKFLIIYILQLKLFNLHKNIDIFGENATGKFCLSTILDIGYF